MIKVLDHGFVRLVDSMGSDLSVVRAARVSYNEAWRAGEDEGSDTKLIKYLKKNKHHTPFETVQFTFEVKAPIFVFRQWHRHRTWCLAGDSPLIFNRPCDGKSYPKSIHDVVRSFNSPQQYERLTSMGLRGPEGLTHIVDAWPSGRKPVYKLQTKYGSVKASSDHVFKTPSGGMKLGENPSHVMALVSVGNIKSVGWPVYTESEISQAKWIEFEDGYEVSNIGLIRSYWRQGSRYKKLTPIIKSQSINEQGRAVISVKGKVFQVSKIVADAFLGEIYDSQVLHNNDNPLDNHIRNLYVGSPLDNSNDQYTNGGRIRLREVPVKVFGIHSAGIEDTFDITVAGNHWFAVDNLIVHNSYNELSARYRELPEELYMPSFRAQAVKNKQGSEGVIEDTNDLEKAFKTAYEVAFQAYRYALSKGVAREIARSVLPVATYSHMFGTVNLLNLMRFLALRDHPHAQYEIRVYAEAMRELAKTVAPVSIAAFEEFGA